MKELQHGKTGSAARCAQKVTGRRNTNRILYLGRSCADDDLESSVLFVWHMQSGHGKEYIDSFGFLNSNPLESL